MYERYERKAVNHSAFLRLTKKKKDNDDRDELPAIHERTMEKQRLDERNTTPCHGRYRNST